MSQRTGGLVGITGHQALSSYTRQLIAAAIKDFLGDLSDVTGITSLAAGTDQIFAQAVLERRGRIIAILPAKHYERSFDSEADLRRFRRFLKQAYDVIVMPFDEPSEEAYWSAGREMVDRVDHLLAVWDGEPAGGLGGTADVVRYARDQGKPVTILWPKGARRA